MTTTVTTTAIPTDYTKANILEVAGNFVMNDPSNISVDPLKFFGVVLYHTNPLLIGQCLEHNKADYELATDIITLSYINN